MDQEQVIATLLSENEKLVQENDQLKWMLGLVKENQDLRGRMTFNSDTMEELTGILFLPLDGSQCAVQSCQYTGNYT